MEHKNIMLKSILLAALFAVATYADTNETKQISTNAPAASATNHVDAAKPEVKKAEPAPAPPQGMTLQDLALLKDLARRAATGQLTENFRGVQQLLFLCDKLELDLMRAQGGGR